MLTLKSIYRQMNVWTTRLENILVLLAAILVTILIIIITMGVIGRYFFNSPLAWSVEFSEYILLYVTFFSASWVLRHAGHVNIDMFVNMVSDKIKHVLSVITLLISLAGCLILSWFSFQLTLDSISRGLVMYKMVHMPSYILYLPITIGLTLLSLRLIMLLLERFLPSTTE